MDPRFLDYYNRELSHLRELGGEFAQEFPKIAGRLGIERFECADPYVERLLEGFAFMAARLNLKLDAQFPRFTQHMLEVVYPHYLAPTPSMALVRLSPNMREGSLAGGFKVPRDSVLRGQLGRGEQTACEYRTAHDVSLWPIEIKRVEYGSYRGELGAHVPPHLKTPRAALRFTFKAHGGVTFDKLPIDNLPIYIRGNNSRAMAVYEQCMANVVAVASPGNGPNKGPHRVENGIEPIGFSDEEALLPYGTRSFQGYRLLQEYFSFAQRFMFVGLTAIKETAARCNSDELELAILFDRKNPELEGAVSLDDFALFCTPAVNLFPKRADRIHLNDGDFEHHVVPDRTRPVDYEVHSVTRVIGYGNNSADRTEFFPLYSASQRPGVSGTRSYFTVSRQARRWSEKLKQSGPRSSYMGSEIFLSLVDEFEGPFRSELRQLGVECLCSNRDLPLHMPVGQGQTDFTLESGAPVESIRILAGPSAPRPSAAHGDTAWKLISHLSLNHLTLTDNDPVHGPVALRDLLSLYADLGEPSVRKQIDGLRTVQRQSVTRRLPVPGPVSFGRGIEIALTVDETSFEGTGPFLFAAVLDRFFARYAGLNSFTETVLRSVQRQEVNRWPTRTGTRAAL